MEQIYNTIINTAQLELLFYVALGLQILDVITTYYAFAKIKGVYERNGLMSKVMDRIGLIPTLLIKLGIALGVLVWIKDTEQAPLILGAACAIYTLIVGNNILVIRRGEPK